MTQLRALLLLGPTASGKTALSLLLAKHYPIEIISVDSALVYRGMDIGTAKPTPQEQSVCPHHLIDIRDIAQTYSAAEFADQAERLIPQIASRGHIPLIVGGTMLYAKALREGFDDLPPTDPPVRAQVLQEIREKGLAVVRKELVRIDPVCAARLTDGDTQRIARALEVYRMTGKPMTSFQSGVRTPDGSLPVVGLMPSDRTRLHRDIARRFDAMLQAGFVSEVKTLMAREDFSPDLPSMRAVGYRQAIDFAAGKTDLATFVDKALAATRQLAKRQITWLRSMPKTTLIDPHTQSEDDLFSCIAPVLESILSGIEKNVPSDSGRDVR